MKRVNLEAMIQQEYLYGIGRITKKQLEQQQQEDSDVDKFWRSNLVFVGKVYEDDDSFFRDFH